MSVTELISVILPPIAPVDSGTDHDWAGVEAQLGLTLPQDYKGMISAFGTGMFPADTLVYNPFARSIEANLFSAGLAITDAIRANAAIFDLVPYAFYPECPGLLACARVGYYQGHLCWLTSPDPQEWTIVAAGNDIAAGEYQHYPYSLTTFLAGWFSGTIQVPFWDQDFTSRALSFIVQY